MKIDFEFNTPHGLFRDALHLPDDRMCSPEEIQLMKEERLDGWLAVVAAPPVEEAPADFIEVDGVQYAQVV
jgi:hypothetical protein